MSRCTGSSAARATGGSYRALTRHHRSSWQTHYWSRSAERQSGYVRSEEHTSELQSPDHRVCRLLLEKKKKKNTITHLKITIEVLLTELLSRGEVDCADKFTSIVDEAGACIKKLLLDIAYITASWYGRTSSIKGLTMKRFLDFIIFLLSAWGSGWAKYAINLTEAL